MLSRYFQLRELKTTLRTEVLAGVTTFLTMAYIIIVNPAILEAAGIPRGPSMVATILTAIFGTLLMGLYAKRPFAIAPYMGENAFIAYTVCKVLGYSWQTAMGAILIAGLLFTLLTLLRVRSWLANAIPASLKYSFAVGIGLFLTFIGLNQTGLVKLGVPGAPVHIGDLSQTTTLLAIAGFGLIAMLMIRRVQGAILLGILAITAVSIPLGVTAAPEGWVSWPPSLAPLFLKLDWRGAIAFAFFPIILTIFVMAFLDTIGTLIGVSARAGLLDEEGNLPQIEKPMLADSLSTCFAALVGTSTAGAFLESAAGVAAGGRSGLTAVVTALLFALAIFFTPVLTAIPAHAYGPALIIVGALMLSPIARLDFEDLSELIPAFCVIALMVFTFNIAIGMTAGFIFYPLGKLASGKIREVNAGVWFLAALSLVFYLFYPY